MVRDFLDELISDTEKPAFERAKLPWGIEEKLARVDWAKSDVLIVNVVDEAIFTACLEELSCAVKCDEISKGHLPIHFVAIYQPGLGSSRSGQRFIRNWMRV